MRVEIDSSLGFVYDPANQGGRCALVCSGDHRALYMSIKTSTSRQDPDPRSLARLDLPNDDFHVDLRCFYSSRSPEVELQPKAVNSAVLSPSEEDKLLADMKKMLKKLESVTRDMSKWLFSHRNYYLNRATWPCLEIHCLSSKS